MRRVVLYTITAVILSGISAPVDGAIIEVPADQPTIQAGIDASAIGDTVLVAPGTYFENIDFKGRTILLTSHFMLDHNPDHIFETIIDGSQPTHPDTGSVVRMANNENQFTVFQGFTVTHGTGTKWLDPHGAGTFREGGGILTEHSRPVIQYNYIVDNEAIAGGPGFPGLVNAGGGGMRCGDGGPTIRNNLIVNNRGNYGSAIVLNFCQATVQNNIVVHNVAGGAYSGGCLWSYGLVSAPGTINGNTFAYNTTSSGTGGVYIWNDAKNFRNNIFWGNLPSNSNLVSNSGVLTVNYCDVEGGWPSGTGNMNVDPLMGGNYAYLRDGSPCIDAGDTAMALNDPEDASSPGNAIWPARGTLRCDMGAYGGPFSFAFEHIAAVADTTYGWAPLHVNFESYSAVNASSWNWDFGDGAKSGSTAAHDYSTPGLFNVSVAADTGGGMVSGVLNSPVIALADTVMAETDSALGGHPVVIEISAHNNVPLSQIVVPVDYGAGDFALIFDSASIAGARTDYFASVSLLDDDAMNNRVTVELMNSVGGSEPELAAGSGPILYLYFTMPEAAHKGQQASVVLDGYSSYAPLFSGSLLSYDPVNVNGSVTALNCCINVRGNVDGDPDDEINVADITFLVNYSFKAGPEPPCLDEANVDGSEDGSINIADLTRLVAYSFKSGPAPAACP